MSQSYEDYCVLGCDAKSVIDMYQHFAETYCLLLYVFTVQEYSESYFMYVSNCALLLV